MALTDSPVPGYVEVEWLTSDERDLALASFKDKWLATEPPELTVLGELSPEQLTGAMATRQKLSTQSRFEGIMMQT